MALWKESTQRDTVFGDNDKPETDVMPTASTMRPPVHSEGKTKETVISAGLTVEGKIEGEGNVRVAGRFQGEMGRNKRPAPNSHRAASDPKEPPCQFLGAAAYDGDGPVDALPACGTTKGIRWWAIFPDRASIIAPL